MVLLHALTKPNGSKALLPHIAAPGRAADSARLPVAALQQLTPLCLGMRSQDKVFTCAAGKRAPVEMIESFLENKKSFSLSPCDLLFVRVLHQ